MNFDSTRWRQRIASITTSSGESIRLNYIDCLSPPSVQERGVILLIHGFPQTSYQFRHVITPISDAGYRVIAPDYRGAGSSSKPPGGYEKSQMAEDLYTLIRSHLAIQSNIHIVGHDIGGMIAFAFASRYQKDVASVIWGECPLPGTKFYEEVKGTPDVFHFVFHRVPDLPEALITGREKIYLKHFFDKISLNSAFLTPNDLDIYTLAFSQPGAMRAGIEVYRAFERDAEQNRDWIKMKGKLQKPTLGMFGGGFLLAAQADNMLQEVHQVYEKLVVEDSGHYIAEENPKAFIDGVLAFVGKHKD
jgi:pimeloyl-ACP methyl ester carboxylesterase